MNAEKVRKCVAIIDKLMKMPCAQMFKYPLRNSFTEEEYRYYLKTIRSGKAMDLYTIKRKLENGIYKNTDEVDSDVRLIKRNCSDYNGPAAGYTLLCQEMLTKYRKIKQEYFIRKIESFAIRTTKLIQKLDNLLAEHPKGISALAAFDSFKDSSTENAREASIVKLKESLDKLVSKDQRIQMLFLLKECEPAYVSGQNNLEVDLTKLKRETITRLDKFVAEQNSNQNVSFP